MKSSIVLKRINNWIKVRKKKKKNVKQRLVSKPTQNELHEFLPKLNQSQNKPGILQVVPGFANNFRPKSLDLSEQMLTNLFDAVHTTSPCDKLLELSQETYAKSKISQEEAAKIEKETRNQHNSTKWFLLRAGRMTASVMKDACRTNQENSAKSLIKKICYKSKFRSIATDWGCMHEDETRAAYVDIVSKKHQTFL